VTERPILFSGEMVRAILEGRKTQTRRVVKPQPEIRDLNLGYSAIPMLCFKKKSSGWWLWPNATEQIIAECPVGKPGNKLWVREQLTRPDGDPWLYASDRQPVMVDACDETAMLTWAHHKQQDYCPSIHMPRWASRITLEITGVRVERLQSISEVDASAEGVSYDDKPVHRAGMGYANNRRELFWGLWDSINGKSHPWAENPWVWAVEYRRIA
jgi:hypothetical protein